MRASTSISSADVLVLDVNIVLAAQRADHPQHERVRPWLDELRRDEVDHAVPSSVWASFLRLTTNRRVFPVPSTLAEAFAFIEAAQAHPRCRRLEPGERHLALVRRLCEEADAGGDLVPDAVLGAIALEHGAAVASLDRDFARFTSIEHVRPGAGREERSSGSRLAGVVTRPDLANGGPGDRPADSLPR